MSSIGDVTLWLQQLKAGDRQAAQPLWERYFLRLVGLARERLRGLPRSSGDSEDVALSAFDSFYRRAEKGKFPRLEDRDDLWQVLAMILRRKACDLVKYELQEIRDCTRTQSLGDEGPQPFSAEPNPEDAAETSEEMARLLKLLPKKRMQDIAVWKMEGRTNEEIAGLIGRTVVTVEYQLRLIRKFWKKELPE